MMSLNQKAICEKRVVDNTARGKNQNFVGADGAWTDK
jgi:hypothetical protein